MSFREARAAALPQRFSASTARPRSFEVPCASLKTFRPRNARLWMVPTSPHRNSGFSKAPYKLASLAEAEISSAPPPPAIISLHRT